ncbi:hypothetical protein N7468_001241 [Penicillium chermesinum]|uniref:Rhodopsin domain-containing protein n=1 Tax=Penicillium chermesinum TaxID=63820 RepID=A0A9W9PG70_9EURO|nr:uncharacterized protein N7468_001241 [Penicillium chermesinum]KAJ5246258.1 hypothetical protein N7468_001241 [Penicillium chermesinum]KAJ6144545.1 hypothetical protein N7470_008440 [Penicillium chermesinum]
MKPELRETWTPAVNILTWFMLVTSILSVFTRLGTKIWIFRKFTTDDFFSIGAVVTCIAQSIAVSVAANEGLGQHMGKLSSGSRDKMMKAQYAASILFIASMCCSKLAMLFFIRHLSPASLDRRFSLALAIFIGLWTVSGIIAASFECHVPLTWNYIGGHCYNMVAWWTYLAVTNILSELGIVAQALLVIVRVQADANKKLVLTGVFGLRIVYVLPSNLDSELSKTHFVPLSVIVAIICQLVYFYQSRSSTDPSWDAWTVTVSTQMVQALSIITSCAPQFKPFLDSLRSSGMALGGSSYNSRPRTYAYGTTYKSRRGRTGDASETHELVSMPDAHRALVTASPDFDAQSQVSQAQIKETRSWMVTESSREGI